MNNFKIKRYEDIAATAKYEIRVDDIYAERLSRTLTSLMKKHYKVNVDTFTLNITLDDIYNIMTDSEDIDEKYYVNYENTSSLHTVDTLADIIHEYIDEDLWAYEVDMEYHDSHGYDDFIDINGKIILI